MVRLRPKWMPLALNRCAQVLVEEVIVVMCNRGSYDAWLHCQFHGAVVKLA